MSSNSQLRRTIFNKKLLTPFPMNQDSSTASERGMTMVSPPEDEVEHGKKISWASLGPKIETGLIVTGILAIFFLLPRNTGGDGWKLFGDAYHLTIIYNQLLFAGTLLVGYALLKKRMDQALLRKFYLLLIIASIPYTFFW